MFAIALPRVASAGDVWHAIAHVGWRDAVVLSVVATWNLMTYWLVWLAATPGLRVGPAVLVSLAPTALANTVPAGSYVAIGLTYSMLHSFGRERPDAARAVVVSGAWNNFAKLALPVVAVSLLALDGDADGPAVAAAATGLATSVAAATALGAVLRSDAAAAWIGRAAARGAGAALRIVGRPPPTGWDAALTSFRGRTTDLVRRRWAPITAATIVSHLSLFLVMLVAIRATGVPATDVGAREAFAVFALGRLATALPVTPGGAGVAELTFTAGLVAAGGPRAPVVAGVLVFRALTYAVQIPLGLVAYGLWRARRPQRAGNMREAGARWNNAR